MPTKSDFADWLSPILVKELRQGLKTRVFVGTFIIVQVVMIVLMGLQLLVLSNDSGSGTSEAFEVFFWAFVWVPLVFLMPARGLTAISEEAKANTLDLVQLTRLSAFRIVLGKWTALAAQTLMMVAAVLPYAVLRYFFGSVDIVKDMQNLALLLAASLVLTAAAIALSTAHLAVRILMIVGGLLMFPLGGAFMAMRSFGMASSSTPLDLFGEWWFQLITLPIYVFMFLEIAASKIAPASENHAARKRTLALLLGLVLPVCAWCKAGDFGRTWFIAFAPIWAWIMVEALCEKTSEVPSLYVPIVKRGAVGRWLGRLLLYPGWASAIPFSLALIACGIVAMQVESHRAATPLTANQFLGMTVFAVLFPATVISPLLALLFLQRTRQRMWFYILFQLFMALLYLICSIAADSPAGERISAYYWLSPFPTSSLLALMQKSGNELLVTTYYHVAVPIAVLVMAYLGYRAVREFLRIRKFEDAALSEVALQTPQS